MTNVLLKESPDQCNGPIGCVCVKVLLLLLLLSLIIENIIIINDENMNWPY